MTHGEPTICNRQPAILFLHFKLKGKFSRLCFCVASIHMLGVIRRGVSLFHVRFLWWGYRHHVYGLLQAAKSTSGRPLAAPLAVVRVTTSPFGSVLALRWHRVADVRRTVSRG